MDNTALCVSVSERHSHHLIVLLRFGWLTVLSSMKMVEQELYFFESGPGDTFTHLKKQKNTTQLTGAQGTDGHACFLHFQFFESSVL